jgi:hypothetical protein
VWVNGIYLSETNIEVVSWAISRFAKRLGNTLRERERERERERARARALMGRSSTLVAVRFADILHGGETLVDTWTPANIMS